MEWIPASWRAARSLFITAVLSASCDSSSDVARATGDAAAAREAGTGGHGARREDAGDSCSPFGKATCGAGRVCCFSIERGVCTEPSACNSPVRAECWLPKDCGPDQVCCGTFVPPLAGPGATPTDASLHGTATLFCSATCAAPNVQLCTNSSDCQGGRICSPAPKGGNSGIIAIVVEPIGICRAPDGGAP
jgi:hypothetical protein